MTEIVENFSQKRLIIPPMRKTKTCENGWMDKRVIVNLRRMGKDNIGRKKKTKPLRHIHPAKGSKTLNSEKRGGARRDMYLQKRKKRRQYPTQRQKGG